MTTVDPAELARRVHTAQINLNYTIYCPLTEKYVSLYPNKKMRKTAATANVAEEEDEALRTGGKNDDPTIMDILPQETTDVGKPDMWLVVEKCTEKGQEALDLLRDGKLRLKEAQGTADSGVQKKDKEKKTKKKREKSNNHESISVQRDVTDRETEKQKSQKRIASNAADREGRKGKKHQRDAQKEDGKGKGRDIHDASEEESDGGFFEK